MHLPLLFKLGIQIRNNVLHKGVNFFHDQLQDGRLVAILLLQCFPDHLSDMHGPILFKLSTSTVYDGIHMPATLFCDLIKDDRLVDWPSF